jgi:hypothetical protein
MRSLFILAIALQLGPVSAYALPCASAPKSRTPRWTLDHYLYDSSLRQDWEILIDCNHPAAPARMQLVLDTVRKRPSAKQTSPAPAQNPAPLRIQAGTAVEVSSAADSSASIHLAGTATQTALDGQPIRVRLEPSGHFVIGLVRGPHSVELAESTKLSWDKP